MRSVRALAKTPPACRRVKFGEGAGLSGNGAEPAGETPPQRRVRMGPGEMQDDPADGADDLDADRDQGLPESRHLGAAERGPVQPELQLLKQHEGRRGQGDAQLIGPEASAAGPSEG